MKITGDFDTRPVGTFGKSHGLKGEIVLNIDNDAFTPEAGHFIFAIVDGGLQVPYRIAGVRTIKGDVVVLNLDDVNHDDTAAFCGLTATAPVDDCPEEISDDDVFYLEDLEGFEAFDGDRHLGTITDIDDSTMNVLINIATPDGRTIIVPAAEELINELDTENKTVVFDLPQGLADLN